MGEPFEIIDGIEFDEGGLPVHLAMPVNKAGEGPVSESDPDFAKIVCWCGDNACKKYFGAVADG